MPDDVLRIVGIDEGQFFDDGLVEVAEMLACAGKNLIIAGLDLDYLGRPFEPIPTLMTRAEYVTAVAHFYRAEMHRSLVWRSRLDTTTNWAVVATVAILTFSFNNPQYSSETLIAFRAYSKHDLDRLFSVGFD